MKKLALIVTVLMLLGNCLGAAPAEEQPLSPYEQGEQAYAAGDYAAAAAWYEQAAAQGNSQAMYRLGTLYGDDSLALYDIRQAMAWYQEAYEHFNFFVIHVIINLCDDAAEAYGVEFYQEIVPWFEKVSAYGDASVLYQLGRFYFDEAYGMRDLTQAARWFEKLVDKEENAYALFYLYQIYQDPAFPEADEQKAAEWLERAANAGSPKAMELVQKQPEEEEEGRIPTESKYAMMRVVQPFLEELGLLAPCPESAILAWEERVYLSVHPMDVSPVEHEGETFPITYFHKMQDCAPDLVCDTNFMTIRFWSADQVIRPCPVCMPQGVELLIQATQEANQKISFSIGFFDQVGDDKEYVDQFVLQLEPDTYEILCAGVCEDLIQEPNMYSLRPVYRPAYLATPYEAAELVQACPCCYGRNFQPEFWENAASEWVYCTTCGSLWETACAASYK